MINKTILVEAGFQFNNVLDQQYTRVLPNNPYYHIPFEISAKGDNFNPTCGQIIKIQEKAA